MDATTDTGQQSELYIIQKNTPLSKQNDHLTASSGELFVILTKSKHELNPRTKDHR